MEKLKVIYEDNHIIVVEKIPNIPTSVSKVQYELALSKIEKFKL